MKIKIVGLEGYIVLEVSPNNDSEREISDEYSQDLVISQTRVVLNNPGAGAELTASFNSQFTITALGDFRDQLEKIVKELSGRAELSSILGDFKCRGVMGSGGRIEWQVNVAIGESLKTEFVLNADQTFLSTLIA